MTSEFSAAAGYVTQETDEKEAEEEEETEEESDQDDDEKETGTKDLDKAVDLSISATTTRDLDKVVRLCESALKKGLEDENVEIANSLISASLMKYADQAAQRILDPSQRDVRWRVFRREALARLTKLEKYDPDNEQAFLLAAKLNGMEGGDRDKARASIDKVIELAGADPERKSEALFLRAALTRDADKRLADLDEAIKLDENNLDAVRSRGSFYLLTGKRDKAVEDFRLWVEKDPENIDAYVVLADTLRTMEKYEEAIEVFDEAIEKKPDYMPSYLSRAELNLDREKSDLALKDVSKALKIEPDNVNALMLRVRVLFTCLLYTSPSPRDRQKSRMPSSA